MAKYAEHRPLYRLCGNQHKRYGATGGHGDVLDIIRHRLCAPTLRAALDEARVFLALPAAGDGAPLLVGEGIETVLSLFTAVPQISAAAALSAESLR